MREILSGASLAEAAPAPAGSNLGRICPGVRLVCNEQGVAAIATGSGSFGGSSFLRRQWKLRPMLLA